MQIQSIGDVTPNVTGVEGATPTTMASPPPTPHLAGTLDGIAQQLSMTPAELRGSLAGGASITDLAEQQGVSRDSLVKSVESQPAEPSGARARAARRDHPRPDGQPGLRPPPPLRRRAASGGARRSGAGVRAAAGPPGVSDSPAGAAWEWEATGTRWRIYHGGSVTANVAQAVARFVERDEARWSRFRADSEIARINVAPGRPVAVSPETFDLLVACAAWQRETGGVVQPLVGRALGAWGYERSLSERDPFVERSPEPRAVTASLTLDAESRSVRIPPGTYLRPRRDRQELDGGARRRRARRRAGRSGAARRRRRRPDSGPRDARGRGRAPGHRGEPRRQAASRRGAGSRDIG
jgi:hypothetical protein